MATKAMKQSSARPISKLDLMKPVKIGASAKPRSEAEVFAPSPSTLAFTVATWRPSFTPWRT